MANININISGLVQSTGHAGFTIQDCIHEQIDGALDSNATRVVCSHVRIDGNPYLIVADDGDGMTKEKADKCYCLHNKKEATHLRNGCFGIGKSFSEGKLSSLTAKSTTLTKARDSRILEVVADWPDAVRNNQWNPISTGLTVDEQEHWREYAFSHEHGTVVIIPLSQDSNNYVESELNSICKELGFVYQSYLSNGRSIEFLGMQIAPTHTLELERVSRQQWGMEMLEVWTHPQHAMRVYFEGTTRDGSRCMLRFTDIGAATSRALPKKSNSDYPPPEGFTRAVTMTLKHSYDPQWSEDNADSEVKGFLSFKRGPRHIMRRPNDLSNSGDFPGRHVIRDARHELAYDFNADKLLDTQINKSSIRFEAMHTSLRKTIQVLCKNWSSAYYKLYIKPNLHVEDEEDGGDEVESRIRDQLVTRFKTELVNNPDFFLEMRNRFVL